jgi:glycosyltransferase involved in cell wall biosynthesis
MASSQPSICCVIPTFNRWDFLAQRITELEQVYREAQGAFKLEIVVVDDHSSLFCPAPLIRHIYALSGRYLRLHKNSGCVSIPRNVGIANSVSAYIAHIDDDVKIFPDKFQILMQGFSAPIDLVYGGLIIEDAAGNTGYSFRKDWNPSLPNGYGVDGSQFIYRRSVYAKIPLHFAMRGCDWELAKKIYTGANFASVDVPVAVYKWHGGNRSLDPQTKVRPIFPSLYAPYFQLWDGKIDYEPISAL